MRREYRAAGHAERAVQELLALAGRYEPRLRQEKYLVADVRTQAINNDIRWITLQAQIKEAVKAVWVAPVSAKDAFICTPRPQPPPEVLHVCTYHLVVYGTGLEKDYREQLHLGWPPWHKTPGTRYTGTVAKLPHQDQFGRIESDGQVNGLLLRDAKVRNNRRLAEGDAVRFSIAQRGGDKPPKVIAFLVTKDPGPPHEDWLLGREGV